MNNEGQELGKAILDGLSTLSRAQLIERLSTSEGVKCRIKAQIIKAESEGSYDPAWHEKAVKALRCWNYNSAQLQRRMAYLKAQAHETHSQAQNKFVKVVASELSERTFRKLATMAGFEAERIDKILSAVA